MAKIDWELEQIEELIRRVKVSEAEERMRALLFQFGRDELGVWEPDLRRTIAEFHPKRRRKLVDELDSLLATDHEILVTAPLATDLTPDDLRQRIESDLADLSERHIFQWSTFYRDAIDLWWPDLMNLARSGDGVEALDTVLGVSVKDHAKEIFTKGYYFQARSQNTPIDQAIDKSLGGLQRFLDLPVERYSTSLLSQERVERPRHLRRVASTFIAEILAGYGSVEFGSQSGWQLLPRLPRSWVSYVGFLTAEDLASLLTQMEPGALVAGLKGAVLPLLTALDGLLEDAAEYSALPALGQLIWDQRRLDLTLRPLRAIETGVPLETSCFLDSSFVRLAQMKELTSRNVGLVIGPLRRDLHEQAVNLPGIPDVLLDTSNLPEDTTSVARRARDILRRSLYRQQSPRSASSPITYNFAREFPIHNPSLTRYFFVHRASVRDLLRSFERRNGIRLWCSIRRSGKTTACFDLSATAGESVVVAQTCEGTDPHQRKTIFYDAVSRALADRRDIDGHFFECIVEECADDRASSATRYVFMLDEYETIFNRLRLAVRRDPELRYTVVQPLLSQLVRFSADNLLVLVGQQPDAHFILMDQNQLSSYVEQDLFPLFSHQDRGRGSEMELLLQKVLTDRITFESAFVDAVYAETDGHPFLLVKVMVDLVDWLISNERPLRDLSLSGADFEEFAAEQLTPRRIVGKEEYAFFREAIREATSKDGLSSTPWLHFVYRLLRQIERDGHSDDGLSRSDAGRMLEDLQLYDHGIAPDELLVSAARANFLTLDADRVRPRIRLLGRIAGATGSRVKP